MPDSNPIHIFGIRHHGPGSARSVRRALEELAPDIVLVEGPPEGEEALPLLTHPQMRPPVSLLLYVPEEPRRSVHYPFAVYSPEWQALSYALERSIPARFMDLPQSHWLAIEAQREAEFKARLEAELNAQVEAAEAEGEAPEEAEDGQAEEVAPAPSEGQAPEEAGQPGSIRSDPLRWMAEAAGYEDGETWWEQVVEQRRDPAGLFDGVLEMMCALREAAGPDDDETEPLREAWMRQTMRAAVREGYQRIAVVCGAWHAPALAAMPSVRDDEERLKGLPKTKVAVTWAPWTYGRLTSWSGYGAGIESPAWYERLWLSPGNAATAWMARAAQLLRAEDLPASPASVIEGIRLAQALAAVRERPAPGLGDLWEAARAVFCFGGDAPMRLIRDKLVVGEKLGEVPDITPMLPLQEDLRREQRRLRLAPEASRTEKDLDLRNATDLDRSRLLHRLNLLGVPWGEVARTGGGKGTFHEIWALQWQPEYEVELITANVWGRTIADAATAKTRDMAAETQELGELTTLVEKALLADLPDAISTLMGRLESTAAVTSDIPHLMEALPPLANVLRYGNVRQTDTSMVAHVVDGLVPRICIGLPGACSSLNDEAAEAMYNHVLATHQTLEMLQREDYREEWNATLAQLADQQGLHGLVAGRCCRLLLDQSLWPPEEVARRMNLALSTAGEPADAAAWVEGLLRGSGVMLLHSDALWQIIDGWVAGLPEVTFTQILPLLRRTFATFPAGERRQMGERAKSGPTRSRGPATAEDFDLERARRVLPLVAQLLGIADERTAP